MSKYDIDSIESLSFKDGVRKRIGMYLGSADMQGVYNGIQEIISNSVDEYYMGHGTKVQISLGKDNLVTIIDEGRGIPFGEKADGSNVLVDIFTKSHTGGKFNDKVYQSVVGLNGTGAKATCLSSDRFVVETWRGGVAAKAVFKKGVLVDYKESPIKDKMKSGTHIEFVPDGEVFDLEKIEIDFNVLCEKCKNLSYLTKGLTFELTNLAEPKSKKITYCAKRGLLDLLDAKVVTPVHSTPIYYETKYGDTFVEIALQWTKHYEESYVFTNGLQNTEGGTSLTGLRSAITRTVNKQFGKSFSGNTARAGLVYAISVKTPNPSFANQTKTKINNPELRGYADKAFCEAFAIFSSKYPKDIEEINEYLNREQKAENAAQKARDAVINYTKEEQAAKKKKVLMADKLKDAEFLGEDSILLVVEGDSAGSSMAVGRDTTKYGILPIKGKILNCLSHELDECLENEEIKSLLLALGCDIQDRYSSRKLRYGKVAICVDSDSDGSHIALLIMALFHKLIPKFLLEERLCWLKAPIYKVQKGKDSSFFYSEEDYQKTKGGGEVTKFKGLGQMSAKDTKESMFSKTQQRMETLVPTKEALNKLELLMGKNVQPRKDFVFKYIDFTKVEV